MIESNNSTSSLHASRADSSSTKWRTIFGLIIVTLLFICLINLGMWQIERANEKESNALALRVQSSNELVLLPTGVPTQRLNQQWISLRGKFLHQYTLLLDNVVKAGRVGYEVLVPMQVEGTPEYVLVNLGWVQAPTSRQQLPKLQQWLSTRLIRGQLYLPTLNPYVLAAPKQMGWPKRVAKISTEKIAPQIGNDLSPWVIRLSEDSAIGYDKNWRWSNNMTAQKHRGYAFQWFALALTLLILTGYFVFRQRRLDD